MGPVQTGEEKALGEPDSSLLVPVRKLSRRWIQAIHRGSDIWLRRSLSLLAESLGIQHYLLYRKTIRKQSSQFGIHKSMASDGLYLRVLRELAISWQLSEVPNEHKKTNITPIFRKSKKANPSNNRPVSLTFVLRRSCSKSSWKPYPGICTTRSNGLAPGLADGQGIAAVSVLLYWTGWNSGVNSSRRDCDLWMNPRIALKGLWSKDKSTLDKVHLEASVAVDEVHAAAESTFSKLMDDTKLEMDILKNPAAIQRVLNELDK
ncbi:hypothetical protein QYF61_013101 [Mycteria americana]|uniref:Uncharacterized protein n=1 Tax=Mycteria americana TaxID=33587 RepID=A0AAN7PQX7_MYCAM|nr:hypothetical protein QYF61_013101 [Mycteria americana]